MLPKSKPDIPQMLDPRRSNQNQGSFYYRVFLILSHTLTLLKVPITCDRQNVEWQSFGTRLHVIINSSSARLHLNRVKVRDSLEDSDKDFGKILRFPFPSILFLGGCKDLAPSTFQDWKPITGRYPLAKSQ